VTTSATTPSGAGWRLFSQTDISFAYEVAVANDPRWWRVSRWGLAPATIIETIGLFSAGVVISSGLRDVGVAALSETGAAGTGAIDVWCMPDDEARETTSTVMVELIASAFGVSGIRALYHERFENDPYLLGATEALWRPQAVFPDFALIDGVYEDREIRVLWREEFEDAFFHHVTGVE